MRLYRNRVEPSIMRRGAFVGKNSVESFAQRCALAQRCTKLLRCASERARPSADALRCCLTVAFPRNFEL